MIQKDIIQLPSGCLAGAEKQAPERYDFFFAVEDVFERANWQLRGPLCKHCTLFLERVLNACRQRHQDLKPQKRGVWLTEAIVQKLALAGCRSW